MLHLLGPATRLCDGLSRREFLRVGGLGLAGLSLPRLLECRAAGAAETASSRARCVIQLYMWGGPSHLETFDLKPDAPEGIRGEFRPIDTNVPGIRISEHLPRLAQMADRFAIIRSLTHTGTNHGTSAYHMLTGHLHPNAGPGQRASPNDMPAVGCAVARFGRSPADLPAYVSLPSKLIEGDGRIVPGQNEGILGQRLAPFYAHGDPTRPDFSIESLDLPEEIGAGRLRGRIRLQQALDRQAQALGRISAAAQAMSPHYERAFRLLQSDRARKAFHLAQEPDRLRRRYGWHHFGQSCLLARRLAEAGVPLVTVYWNVGAAGADGNWDTHANSFSRLKDQLLPPFEQAYTALLEDLQQRGLLEQTLVVWMGEFGRTPRINKNAGRDHWGFCQSVLLAGGGVRGGQVLGSSDACGAYAAELPLAPDDLAATVFDCLGIRLDHELHDAQGRPLPLCKGKPIDGLFAAS